LKRVFIPQSRRGRSEEDTSYWRLLILDGHGSHTTGEFIFECLINQVLLIYLLPHTSHLCQPCDFGPFAQLTSFYSKHLKSYILAGETQKFPNDGLFRVKPALFKIIQLKPKSIIACNDVIAVAGVRGTRSVLQRSGAYIRRQTS
jgi:hypothetical protein